MWNSLLETWTLALAPHTPQALILMKWPPHQGYTVVAESIFNRCKLLIFTQKKNKRASEHVQRAYLDASTIYKRIFLFELDFFVIQKYPH